MQVAETSIMQLYMEYAKPGVRIELDVENKVGESCTIHLWPIPHRCTPAAHRGPLKVAASVARNVSSAPLSERRVLELDRTLKPGDSLERARMSGYRWAEYIPADATIVAIRRYLEPTLSGVDFSELAPGSVVLLRGIERDVRIVVSPASAVSRDMTKVRGNTVIEAVGSADAWRAYTPEHQSTASVGELFQYGNVRYISPVIHIQVE